MREGIYQELERLHELKNKCDTKWQLELVYGRIEYLHDLLNAED